MCCVMPPNSFSATFDLRMASRSDVLPWSTWPMTVTTGGRSTWVPVSASSSSRTSPSTERISTSKPNLSATSLASVGSSRSLTIRMTPSSSRPLMTSPDLRRIFSASSATVTDSGTRMSSRRTSAGGAGGASTASGVVTRAAGASAAGLAGAGGAPAAGAAGRGAAGRGGAGGPAGRPAPCIPRGGANGRAGGPDGGAGGGGLGLLRARLLRHDLGAVDDGAIFLRRLRLRDALGLDRLLGELTSLAQLGAQLVGELRVEGSHGAHALVAHLLGRQHQILARDAELLRQLDDFHLGRCHSPLTSPKPRFRSTPSSLRSARGTRAPGARASARAPGTPDRDRRTPRAPARCRRSSRGRRPRAPAAASPPWAAGGGSPGTYGSARPPSSSRRRGRVLRLRHRAVVLLRVLRFALRHPRLGGGENRVGGGADGRQLREPLAPGCHHSARRDEPRFDERLECLRRHAGEGGQRRARRLGVLRLGALGFDLALALDVDAHAGELGRQPRVLPLLADGERELVVGNDHQRRHVCLTVGLAALGRLLGDGHRRHLRGRQRARHERGRVVRPLDDVDLLAAQLAADDLDARAAQAHAGADGFHVALGGGHRDLGALAALARRRLDDDDPLLDLGDLRLEEPREVARVCARERDLRALGRAPHLEHVGAHAVARVVALPGDLLALGQDRLRLADLQDHVALLDPVHDAAEDLAFLADELRVDALALGVADLLEDDLLGGLGRDAAEVLQRSVLQQLQLDAELGRGIERLGVSQRDLRLRVGDVLDHLLALVDAEVARLAVDVDADVVGRPQALAGCRQQGSLQRLEEDLFVDPLLASELLDDHDQFAIHLSCDRLLQGTSASSLAFVTLARSSLASVPPSCSRTICPPSRPSSRPRTSCPPASQQHTRLPTAQRNSRSVRSWRSSPGDATSRSYASSINADASSTSPTSRLSRWQSSMPTPPGLSTNKRSTPRCRRGRHSRSTSINP